MEIRRSLPMRCARIPTYLARFQSLVSPLVWLGLKSRLLNFLKSDKLFQSFFERTEAPGFRAPILFLTARDTVRNKALKHHEKFDDLPHAPKLLVPQLRDLLLV